MTVRYMRFISRAYLQAHPKILVPWGDNLAGYGMGGQAAEMRGEPNAVSIYTKKKPTRNDDAYFTDADLDLFRENLLIPYRLLRAHLDNGGTVSCPSAGVGTDRAALPLRAPRCFKMLRLAFFKLDINPPDWKAIP